MINEAIEQVLKNKDYVLENMIKNTVQQCIADHFGVNVNKSYGSKVTLHHDSLLKKLVEKQLDFDELDAQVEKSIKQAISTDKKIKTAKLYTREQIKDIINNTIVDKIDTLINDKNRVLSKFIQEEVDKHPMFSEAKLIKLISEQFNEN